MATPAISDGVIIVRGLKDVFAIAAPKAVPKPAPAPEAGR